MTIKIGIPAQDQPDNKFGCNTNYLQWIYQFGSPIIILPENYDNFKEIYKLDALVLPGGADIDYKRYSKVPNLGNYNPNTYLEHFDINILPNLIGQIPVFGICRGLQSINVFFGGTLKNLWFHPYSTYENDTVHFAWEPDKKNEYRNKNSYLLKVNSFHHQAIGQLANNLKTELIDFEDNVIEAISDYDKSVFAVQWHPERLKDSYSYKVFTSILR